MDDNLMFKEANRIFNLFDANQQGFISIDAFKRLMQNLSLENHDEAHLQQLVESFDPDKSGFITLNNFTNGVLKMLNLVDDSKNSLEADTSTDMTHSPSDCSPTNIEPSTAFSNCQLLSTPNNYQLDKTKSNEIAFNQRQSQQTDHLLSFDDEEQFESTPELVSVESVDFLSELQESEVKTSLDLKMINKDLINSRNANKVIESLQKKISSLTNAQVESDFKYEKTKKENCELLNYVQQLEDRIAERKCQVESDLKEEKRRHKNALEKFERERNVERENFLSQILGLEESIKETKDRITKLKLDVERSEEQNIKIQEVVEKKSAKIVDLKNEIFKMKEEIKQMEEREKLNKQIISDLEEDLENLGDNKDFRRRSSTSLSAKFINMSVYLEKTDEMLKYKNENSNLIRKNEEIRQQMESSFEKSQDFSQINSQEILHLNDQQLEKAIADQNEITAKLRSYLNGILANIVENYPELLEVKNNN